LVTLFVFFDLHVELLVEIAVKDAALPVDADGVSAHESVNGGGVEIFDEELVVFGELFVALEVGGVASDRHVGDAVEVVEFDIEVFFHLTLVVGFERFLVRWEKGAVGVVDEVELEFWVDAVAEFVELLKGGDGAVKDAVAALFVDVVWGVTGHGGDTDDFMLSMEFGDPFVAGFFDDGGVESGHDFTRLVEGANAFDELAEVRVHFGGATGEVDGGEVGGFKPVEGAVEVVAGDEFFTVRAGVDVAMGAGDVAELAKVKLEDLGGGAGEGELVIREGLVEGVHDGLRREFVVFFAHGGAECAEIFWSSFFTAKITK